MPTPALRAFSDELRSRGYARRGRRGLWVQEHEDVLTAITLSCPDRTEDGEQFWITCGAHAISKTVLRVADQPLDDAHYANFMSWSVDQQDFGGPWSYELTMAQPEPAVTLLRQMLRDHLLPAAATMSDARNLFAHLQRNVFMRCEGPLQLLQFVSWALDRGDTGAAHEAITRYAVVEREIGGPFPLGLLDDLEDLSRKYAAFRPAQAVSAATT